MEWISVEDRLPEYQKNVLVVFTNISKQVVHSVAYVSRMSRHLGEDTPYSDRWWIYSSRSEIKPAHWMPLPEPPNKASK